MYSLIGVLSKTAANQGFLSALFFLLALAVLFLLATYALIWQQVLKRFALAKAYPNKGVVVIWNLLWAAAVFRETITVENIIGSTVIVAGIVLVSADAD